MVRTGFDQQHTPVRILAQSGRECAARGSATYNDDIELHSPPQKKMTTCATLLPIR